MQVLGKHSLCLRRKGKEAARKYTSGNADAGSLKGFVTSVESGLLIVLPNSMICSELLSKKNSQYRSRKEVKA